MATEEQPFPIVGVGASAGGLQAFTELLEHLPTDTGMAFVFIQHLAPHQESMLREILSRSTEIPMHTVTDGMAVEPNHVYVIPPGVEMTLSEGVLHLAPQPEGQRPPMPVDVFLRSLAQDRGARTVGVILSGTGSDGVLGLKAIKGVGGLGFAQNQETASHYGMPHSAIVAGYVDATLSPREIARELARLNQDSFALENLLAAVPSDGAEMQEILALVRRRQRVDFTRYKTTTIKRRIHRRMMLHKADTLQDYLDFLREHPEEVETLFHDFLINVTSFFRDPGSFEVLTEQVFPMLMEERTAERPLRIWVPGCSTGEEIYSIAIALLEYLGERAADMPVQFFATDVSEPAVQEARRGVYPENIALDVSPERLGRFFVRMDRSYQISKFIREMCVFARQDITRDAPFSKLDLISCRNVLIYLDTDLQKQVIPVFHYALNPGGYLMLGSSETVGTMTDLFEPVDTKHRLYRRKQRSTPLHFQFSRVEYPPVLSSPRELRPQDSEDSFDVRREADRLILREYGPAAVIVNSNLEVLQFRGHTGPYLEHMAGDADLNLMRMVRDPLMVEVRAAFHRARRENVSVTKEGLRFHSNGIQRHVHLHVHPMPLPDSDERCYLVVFEKMDALTESLALQVSPPREGRLPAQVEEAEIDELRRELATTQSHLQTIIEEQEASNEELRAANEEIQSSNEELQSINEELETAKEELQSTNEELTTVNEELESRNAELSQTNDDLTNLLRNIDIPILMLDEQLSIRRFTPSAEKVLNIIPTDVGRSISAIKSKVDLPDLGELVPQVIDRLHTVEREVHDKEGNSYTLRMCPYKSMDNVIKGVVLTFLSTTAMKQRDFAQALVDTVREPLVVLDGALHVISANASFYERFQVDETDTVGQRVYELGNGQWDIPALRELLEDIIPEDTSFEDLEVEHEFPHIGQRRMLLNARQIQQEDGGTEMILLAIEDVTGDDGR